MECIRLRVKDLDFERNLAYVCAATGRKDGVTILPKEIYSEMRDQINRVERLHDEDLAQGFAEVNLYRKRRPENARMQIGREFRRQ
jgi:integrase